MHTLVDWDLDAEQHQAATADATALLVIAGAGSGKTRTLVARVAHLVHGGVQPERILLLTFTRRAAAEMLSRAGQVTGDERLRRVNGGTFHSVAHRLLQREGGAVGLHPGFTVLDEADTADLYGLARQELGLAEASVRFPKKETVAAIASRVANTGTGLTDTLDRSFPWCRDHADPLREVLRHVRDRKRANNAVDFDDLLLYWRLLVTDDVHGPRLAGDVDHVLVDEYQDTNVAQADIVAAYAERGVDVTVVGDDAQSIYGFRGATIDNILSFPDRFAADVVTLERNYRSVQPILDASNRLMGQALRRHGKDLHADRPDGVQPVLVTCGDEAEQSAYVCDQVLAARERGVALREQAVLFRTGHHSDALELELARRGIPFRKFGGLKFLETAHVKDVMAALRLLDNPADELAWHRVLRRLDGVGPARARAVQDVLGVGRWRPGDPPATSPLARFRTVDLPVPPTAASQADLLRAVYEGADDVALTEQFERLGTFFAAVWPAHYSDAPARLADLERLGELAVRAGSRQAFVADLVLEPPSSTSDLAGDPHLDDDWLVLSTIHSAKGGEWRAVHVIHAADGNIPSDMALRDKEGAEEERRLLYVAMTRARDELHVTFPLRYHIDRFGTSSRHGYAQLSRFLTPIADHFTKVAATPDNEVDDVVMAGGRQITSVDKALESLWTS